VRYCKVWKRCSLGTEYFRPHDGLGFAHHASTPRQPLSPIDSSSSPSSPLASHPKCHADHPPSPVDATCARHSIHVSPRHARRTPLCKSRHYSGPHISGVAFRTTFVRSFILLLSYTTASRVAYMYITLLAWPRSSRQEYSPTSPPSRVCPKHFSCPLRIPSRVIVATGAHHGLRRHVHPQHPSLTHHSHTLTSHLSPLSLSRLRFPFGIANAPRI